MCTILLENTIRLFSFTVRPYLVQWSLGLLRQDWCLPSIKIKAKDRRPITCYLFGHPRFLLDSYIEVTIWGRDSSIVNRLELTYSAHCEFGFSSTGCRRKELNVFTVSIVNVWATVLSHGHERHFPIRSVWVQCYITARARPLIHPYSIFPWLSLWNLCPRFKIVDKPYSIL